MGRSRAGRRYCAPFYLLGDCTKRDCLQKAQGKRDVYSCGGNPKERRVLFPADAGVFEYFCATRIKTIRAQGGTNAVEISAAIKNFNGIHHVSALDRYNKEIRNKGLVQCSFMGGVAQGRAKGAFERPCIF